MSERWVFLDTETTGLKVRDGHKIIEIGCVEVIDRKFTGRHFHHYINPQREIGEGATKIHGIILEQLTDKPVFADIAADFQGFIKGATVIIHNAEFDLEFLNSELLSAQKSIVEKVCNKVIDSLFEARKLHQGQRNSLDALCKRYNIDDSDRALHGALLDANLLAKVYLSMTAGQSSLALNLDSANRVATNDQVASVSSPQRWPDASMHSVKIIYATEQELEADLQMKK